MTRRKLEEMGILRNDRGIPTAATTNKPQYIEESTFPSDIETIPKINDNFLYLQNTYTRKRQGSPSPTPGSSHTYTSSPALSKTGVPSGTGGHPIYGHLNPVTVIRSVFKAKKKQQQKQQHHSYDDDDGT